MGLYELDLPDLQAEVLAHCEKVPYLGEDEHEVQGVLEYEMVKHGAMAQKIWEGCLSLCLEVVVAFQVVMGVGEMGLELIHLACSAEVVCVLE